MPTTPADGHTPATPIDHIDKEALRRKYLQERDKRLRPDGNGQYLQLAGRLAHYADDPYTPHVPRAPRTDHVTFTFIGGGFAGLVTAARLKEAGITSVRIVEKGGDFGGTWYWNRYPGAQCDTASMVYMPLLEETGHVPSEKYAHAPEILAQCQRIGRQYGLYDGALFHTEVQSLAWDEARAVWVVRTHQGDVFTTQYIGLGTGPLHVPKLPGIPGIELFQGHSFHTSRWDYAYTGGDPSGAPMTPAGRQARGHHRHRRHRGAVRAAPGPGCAAALRVPAHALIGGCARQRAHRPGLVCPGGHTRLATALAGKLHRQPDRWHRHRRPGARRLDRPVAPHPREGDDAAARAAHAGQHDGRLRGRGLREDVRDPCPCRSPRGPPGHGREAQGLVPAAVQAPLLPRRIPAGLQPSQHHAGRHRWPRGRAHHRPWRGGSGHRVRGGLHRLRLGLRGGHRVPAPRRLRHPGPRRPAAVAVLGRGHAQLARHPCARLSPICSSCSPRRAPT